MSRNTNYLEILNLLSLSGNPLALEELSKIAFGGNSEAQKMIRQIDKKKIIFKDEIKTPQIPRRSDLAQIIFHPIESLRAKARQVLVGIDEAQAPVGSNQEDFPNLRIAEASRILRGNRK